MSINVLFDNIHKKFVAYESYLSNSNSLGLTDAAIFAENHMQQILNIIFDWELINANSLKKNQSGYDLIDSSKGIYIQVTSRKDHGVKFKSAITSFKKLYPKQDDVGKLIVLYISSQISRKLLPEVVEGKLMYQAYFIPQLLDKIFYLDHDKLLKIDKILDQILKPINFDSTAKIKIVPSIAIQAVSEIGPGIYIKREKLITELFNFIQKGNGLLTGGPGYGKSFTLEELQRKFLLENVPCYIIRINELNKGSNEEIGKLLGTGKKWLSTLKALRWENNLKGCLIFDAFDTAKDDGLKLEILSVMRLAIKELSLNWNVLTSARTYDAAKSNKLQELFPQEKIGAEIICRNFLVPGLNDEELELALNFKNLKVKASSCASGLQKLLHVPYFLKLFEDILQTSEDVNDINSVETEAQLLEVFWKSKVDESYNNFLSELTKKFVENDSLVCDKLEFVNDSNIVAYTSLVSVNILQEVAMKRNISFAHNILLEFAISKYILKIAVEDQVKLIENSPKLPFHFRQSFVYFYSQMWSSENVIFWEHYNHIKEIGAPLFRLFHHTIFNYVLVHFYKSPSEILPNINSSEEELYGNTVRRTLESIRFARKGKLLDQDLDFILAVSKQINVAYLWELGNLIEIGIQQFEKEQSKTSLQKLSNASCNYMNFVLKERNGQQGWFIDGSGALFGVPNVASSFYFNKIKSKSLLQKVMKILNEKNFPIRYFSFLADNLEKVATVDIEFGFEIYKTLYFFQENSTEETNMGGGATLSLRSNRKQDYNHIHYVLETKYVELMKIDFDNALKVGLEIINKFSSGDGYSYKPKPSLIKVGTIESAIKFDSGYFDEDKEHGPVSFLNKIFHELDSKAENSSDKVITDKLYLIIGIGGASKIWRRLLEFLSTHPKAYVNLSFQILDNSGIYECNETLHEAGELIRAVWPFLSPARKKKIEKLIHVITPIESTYPEWGRTRISRLLSCIPGDSYVLDMSKAFILENGVGENPVIVEDRRPIMAQQYQHTPEERMTYAGFDPEIDRDSSIYPQYRNLEIFNNKFENGTDRKGLRNEYKTIIDSVENLFMSSLSGLFRNELMTHSCDLEISRCARILSEVGKKLNIGERKKYGKSRNII
ncbi:MAG: SMEK domain-containing protein [Flavobacterium sp. JAD_PAG50586_2]|nr:MAG: SMEK domain-containing protein [Flavobacterium sp. JAD_PAG50586_2]